MRRQMVANIQILRGVAASLVVWYHMQAMLNTSFGTGFDSKLGAIGVDLFFVISGFIMFYIGHSTPARIPHFLVNRFFRIVPLYWLATMALVVVFLAGFNPNGLNILTPQIVLESLFFIPSEFENGRHDLALSLGWTLMYELFFFTLFAISFFMRSRLRSFVFVAAVLMLTSFIGTQVEGLSYLQMYYLAPITIEFLFGAVLGLTYQHLGLKTKRLTLMAGVACLALATVMLVVVFQAGWVDLGKFGLRFLTYGVPSFFIVLGFLLLEKANYRIASGPLIKWGDISYSLYLFHPMALQGAVKAVAVVAPINAFGTGTAALFAFAVSIFVAWLIYELIETRIVAYGKSVSKHVLPKSPAPIEAGANPE